MSPSRYRSSRYAILGLLGLAPMSGYEIRKAASNSIGHFWSESYGQIYPTLRELAEEGLVRPLARRGREGRGRAGGSRGGQEPAGRGRREYEITDKGRGVLAAWRSGPPRSQPPRNELLLKLFFGERGSIPDHMAHVRQLIAGETDRLGSYRRLEERIRRKWRKHPSRPFWLMTVSYGRHQSEALIRWSRKALASLRREAATRSAGKTTRARKGGG